jgi:hypothetical protein
LYRKFEFEETGLRKFEHLSFRVCFMEKAFNKVEKIKKGKTKMENGVGRV